MTNLNYCINPFDDFHFAVISAKKLIWRKSKIEYDKQLSTSQNLHKTQKDSVKL